MKKILAIVMAVMVMATVFTGCGKSDSKSHMGHLRSHAKVDMFDGSLLRVK